MALVHSRALRYGIIGKSLAQSLGVPSCLVVRGNQSPRPHTFCKTIYFVILARFSVILIYPHSLFSYFTILSVMTAVTFPLRPPRLAFAICGRRWQNNVYEN